MKRMMQVIAIVAGVAAISTSSTVANAYPKPDAEIAVYTTSTPSAEVRDNYCVDTYRTIACFQPYGDKFWVYDRRDDRYVAQAHWQRLDEFGHVAAHQTCENHYGAGTWAICDKDLMEYRMVRVQADSQNYADDHDGDSSEWLDVPNGCYLPALC